MAVNAVTGSDMWLKYPETQKGFWNLSEFLDMLVPNGNENAPSVIHVLFFIHLTSRLILIDEPYIYYSQAGRIVKLNQQDGSIVWDKKSEITALTRMGTVTLMDGGMFLIAAIQGYVAAYDKNTGNQVWKNDLKGKGCVVDLSKIYCVRYSPVSTALYKDIVIAGCNGYLVSINVSNGILELF